MPELGGNRPASKIDDMHSIDERTAMLALLLRQDARWSVIADEAMESGSAISVLQNRLGHDTLFPDLVDEAPEVIQAQKMIASCRSEGTQVLSFLDPDYPSQLRDIHEMPPLVFAGDSFNRTREPSLWWARAKLRSTDCAWPTASLRAWGQ